MMCGCASAAREVLKKKVSALSNIAFQKYTAKNSFEDSSLGNLTDLFFF